MRWVALLQPTETISGGIYFVQPAERGMSEMFLGQNEDKLFIKKKLFSKIVPASLPFYEKRAFSRPGVCWYTLSLSSHLQYISPAHLSPEIIFSHVSHFNVLAIQFSKDELQKESQ